MADLKRLAVVDVELADRMIEFMNELLKVDSAAVNRLVCARVECNEDLARHPTVQVAAAGEFLMGVDGAKETWRSPTVALIGVLNGLCGANDDGWGAVAVEVDTETGEIQRFSRSGPFREEEDDGS